MTCLVSKIDYLQVLSMVQSIFIRLGGTGKKVTAILRRSSSRGLCTPEVKIASVPVPAFTGNKMPSSNLQMREEQPPDRPELAEIARDRSLKQIKSKYKTREAYDGKKVLLHYRNNQFPVQHLCYYRQHDVLHCLQRSCFIKEMHFVISLCHAIVSQNILNVILTSYILTR